MDCLSLPGAIYIWWNMKKNVYKNLQSNFFLNRQQMGKVIRAFCWHQKFVPKGLSALALGLYTYIKSFVYRIRFLFLNLQRMGKVIRAFCWHQKFIQWVLCPCPGAIYMSLKNVYKIRFRQFQHPTRDQMSFMPYCDSPIQSPLCPSYT